VAHKWPMHVAPQFAASNQETWEAVRFVVESAIQLTEKKVAPNVESKEARCSSRAGYTCRG
jgi:hypothetical protein